MSLIVNITNPGLAPVDGDLIEVDGKVRKVFHETPAPDPYDLSTMTVEVELDESIIALGDSVNISSTVRMITGDPAPLTATYYVPVIGIDGTQSSLLVVNFVDGVALVGYTPSKVGIFTIDLSNARPVPQAHLPVAPEVIVTAE